MTTSEIDPNGYAVVWFGDDGKSEPKICKGVTGGTRIDGVDYAIFDNAEEATEEMLRWPHYHSRYGVLPVALLIEERPKYVVKESALQD